MKISTRSSAFRSGSSGRPCSTHGWAGTLVWSSGVDRFYRMGGPYRAAIDRLIRHHDRKLPPMLHCGRDVSSKLEDEGLFPDDIFLMTSCGSNAEWESVRTGKVRLHSLIAFPSSF